MFVKNFIDMIEVFFAKSYYSKFSEYLIERKNYQGEKLTIVCESAIADREQV